MINGEGWLKNDVQCELEVIPCKNFYHGKSYTLPVNPSPNLSNDHAISIYPSSCFFEGTVVSEGRGTDSPFEVFGHPLMKGEYSFTPVSMPGKSTYPKLQGQLCFGEDLRDFEPEEGWNKVFINWLIETYEQFPNKDDFFIPFFEKLAGTDSLREQIVAGWSEDAIRKSWEADLDIYRSAREKYLLYP